MGPDKGKDEVIVIKEKVLVAGSEINQTHQDETNKVQEAQQQISLNQQEVGTDNPTMLKKMAPALKGEHKQMHQVEINNTEDKQQQTILKQQQEGPDGDKEREGLATEDN